MIGETMKLVLAAAIAFAGLAHAAGAPPAAAPPARDFVIFFDHGAGWIPEGAQAVLPQVAEIFKRVGYTAIVVTCHSDNLGTQPLNIAMTEDRARRIKGELVRYGVDEAAITATGLGFSDPVVPSAEQDVAVSNRRCIITLS
jgi:OOP family OmpA-OmpF porin